MEIGIVLFKWRDHEGDVQPIRAATLKKDPQNGLVSVQTCPMLLTLWTATSTPKSSKEVLSVAFHHVHTLLMSLQLGMNVITELE